MLTILTGGEMYIDNRYVGTLLYRARMNCWELRGEDGEILSAYTDRDTLVDNILAFSV